MKTRIVFLAMVLASAIASITACSGDDGAPAKVTAGDAGVEASVLAPGDAGIVGTAPDGGFAWNLPRGFPVPLVPADNPMSAEKVALGRRLFYDSRLSKNQTESCASCHKQELAFTDGLAQSVGSTGMHHPRSAMTLANSAYATTLTWADPLLVDFEHQALVPMFGDDPIELGLTDENDLLARLQAVEIYGDLFAKAYPGDSTPFTLAHVVGSLASFERTLISGNSPYDRWIEGGDASGMSDAALRGYQLYHSETFECFHCHEGFGFTDHVAYAGQSFTERPYHNTGLYNIDGKGGYPAPNTGVERVTLDPTDMGRFKTMTLRNIAVTAPYMHDGSIATLDEVLDHYVAGGRTITSGPYAGNGSISPLKDKVIHPLTPTADQRADVIEFLKSLTDTTFLTDPNLSNPWQ